MSKDKDIYKIVSIYAFEQIQENLILNFRDQLSILEKNGLSGLLIIAKEGINGTICGSEKTVDFTINLIKEFINKNELNEKTNYSNKKVFKKLKIKIKQEIVTMGFPKINPKKDTGIHVDPSNWNKLINDKHTIVIDTRNHYEVSLGTFKKSINPNTKNFREFPKWVDDNLEKYISKNNAKKIAMFCTGGIRCEKASSLLKKKGFENIYHLKGGILKYFEDVSPKNNLFEGECFVFDQRVALDQELKKGTYSICHACGMPLSKQDKEDKYFKEGIQCHFCIKKFSDLDRKRFEERQKQIDKIKTRKQIISEKK